MRCPYCADDSNRVIDSRLSRDDTEIRRRRECQECGKRFTTRERVEDVLPRIVKRDERREDFDRRKLLASLEKACAKRPVSVEVLERLADRIEKRLQEGGDSEVPSDRLGEWVLDELVQIDTLAAARFASSIADSIGPVGSNRSIHDSTFSAIGSKRSSSSKSGQSHPSG